MMGQWSELPVDLLEIIEDRLLFYVDKIRIRAVCVSWNYHLLKMPNQVERQFPWLLQAHDNTIEASHALFNPIEKKFYLLELSEAQGKLFKGSSHGWVATAEDKHSRSPTEMYLINPLTRIQIKLPSRNRFPDVRKYHAKKVDNEYSVFTFEEGGELCDYLSCFEINYYDTCKVVLSSAPSDDCLIVAIYGENRRLACCNLNDKRWRPLLADFKEGTSHFLDIIFHKGKLHALNNAGQVWLFENNGVDPNPKVLEIARLGLGTPLRYLVVCSDGGLIMVARYCHYIPTKGMDTIPRTYCFRAFKLDLVNLRWVEVKNIGDDILFVGLNSSLSISSRHFPEYKGNHVYFTDGLYGFGDFGDDNEENDSDIGVFNLEDGTLQSLPGLGRRPKFLWPPPLWVNLG